MNWGNCEATGRTGAGKLDGVSAYRCRVSGQTLIVGRIGRANYSYPWRDNFCEHRNFYVGQCPGGLGHQGQDIRPASCKQRIQGANRCEPYLHDVVAVRDGGDAARAPSGGALHRGQCAHERIRVRYLHMLPRQFDADGMLSGRPVREGEVIGKVGNFFKRERATTYHLHFDLQVPTRYGWVFVNPYMTLVASYERLIQARGQEIKEPDIQRGCAHRVHPPPAGSGALPRDRAGHGRKADRNGGRIARASNHPSEDFGTMSERTGRANLLLSRRACLPLLAAAMAASSAPAWAQGKSGFEQWVEAFRARARARGISDATYTRVMSNIKPDTAVFELNRSQPEFKEQLWQYLNRRVSDWRITTRQGEGQGIRAAASPASRRITASSRSVHAGAVGHRIGLRRSGRPAEPHAAR